MVKKAGLYFFKCTTIQKISSALEYIFLAIMMAWTFKMFSFFILGFSDAFQMLFQDVHVQNQPQLMSWKSYKVFFSQNFYTHSL